MTAVDLAGSLVGGSSPCIAPRALPWRPWAIIGYSVVHLPRAIQDARLSGAKRRLHLPSRLPWAGAKAPRERRCFSALSVPESVCFGLDLGISIASDGCPGSPRHGSYPRHATEDPPSSACSPVPLPAGQ